MADSVLISMQDGVPEPTWFGNVEPFVQKVLQNLGYDGEEISILFCNDSFMQALNKEYRHIDSSTDVLSFENGDVYTDENGTQWKNAGDIVISLDMLPVNAAYFGDDADEELKRLLIHGVLHLNGMDHGEEHIEKNCKPVCEMLSKQEALLEKMKNERIMAV